jgi:hypothetical protein
MAKRRGYVGVVADDCRRATNLTEVFRALQLVLELCGRRADHLANVEAAARAYLAYTDYDTLLARPGHDTITTETGIPRRTLQRCIDTLHELGLLVTVEEGTTPWLRKARLKAGQTDLYEHQDNRAEVYRWCIPRWVDDVLGTNALQESAVHRTDELTGTPSRPSPKERAGSDTSCRRQPAGGYARAREQLADRPQAAGKFTHRTRKRPRRRGSQAWRTRAGDVQAVWQSAMPTELTTLLAEHEAERLANEIAHQLNHRSVDELTERIRRHWDFWRFKLAAGLVRQPIAVAFRMLRRDFDDCPDVRCEDQWQLDKDTPCQHCTMIAESIVNVRRTASTPHSDSPTPNSQTVLPRLLAPALTSPSSSDRRVRAKAVPLPTGRVTSHASHARAMLAASSTGARKIIAKSRASA